MKTEAERIARMASLMAVSNTGHLHNLDIERATDTRWGWNPVARYDVCNIAGHLMENEDHEDYFGDEAESWEKQIREAGAEAFIEQFPHHREMLTKVWNS